MIPLLHFEKPSAYYYSNNQIHLSTKPIKRATLSLQRIHDIQTRHCLSLCVFGVSDSITDDAFEEGLEDATGFFVDH